MIIYFADRQLNIIGQASTKLPGGLTVYDDKRVEDVETGVSSFECFIPYNAETRATAESCAAVGNYLLRSHNGENEFYTIIESESDTKNGEVYIYAEDAGLDLLNEIVGEYAADQAYPIAFYIELFAHDSGFEIGINEASGLTRKLSWEGEATAAERIASVATQFDGCEISFSFEIKGLYITKKLINIHKQRGTDNGVQLRLNFDIDRIVTKTSIVNLATALECEGAIPDEDDATEPITLAGYVYDDGDFYVSGKRLYSRKALEVWSRYVWENEPNQIKGQKGHIVRTFSYDTDSQKTLCAKAIAELKRIREIEVNYEIELDKLPDGVRIGDRVNIIDDAGNLYVSTRILQLETSAANDTQIATLGEFLIKKSGINEKVAQLAAQFAASSKSAARALTVASNAKAAADIAQAEVNAAIESVEEAKAAIEEVADVVENAKAAAENAQAAADEAQQIVESVEGRIDGLETSVANADAAAAQAAQAAATAQTKADEAKTAVANAEAKADEAKAAAATAQETAETANENANAALSAADQAKADATAAATTAAAAKLDAETAQNEIDALGENLTTLETTMQADYARKTDLTEATASLQTQISQNAAEISSTATKVQEIDETANNAAETAAAAQSAAQSAQSEADAAASDAAEAKTAADNAKNAADAAQAEADAAKTAAETAKSVADKAEADLAAAQADLATVAGRVDATEEEIAAAQKAVDEAQAAADTAKSDAAAAAADALAAQTTANNAATEAENAQTTANNAATVAALAQQVADEAKGDASAAQAKADEAASAAAEAQRTADTAVSDAATAQAKANEAVETAATAQQAAADADAKAAQAAEDLAAAEQNLANVSAKADATAEEVEAAKADVEAAKTAAETAKADATAAQQIADQAKADATAAQNAADEAKSKADSAQAAATDAKNAADAAQADVNALAVRVTTAETSIKQNADAIALAATKTEIAETLGGYYTKSETDAAITLKADSITQTVSETYATKKSVEDIEIGGRNLALGTAANYANPGFNVPTGTIAGVNDYVLTDETYNDCIVSRWSGSASSIYSGPYFGINSFLGATLEVGEIYTISAWLKADNETSLRQSAFAEHQTAISYDLDIGTEWRRVWLVFEAVNADGNICFYTAANATADLPFIYMCGIKLERGNKPTDWTVAPEDVDEAIATVNDEVREEIATSATSTIATCESIILSALESYVSTGDYETFKETVQSQLSIMASQISLNFSQLSEQITDVDGEMQSRFNEISTFFTFDINGLTIGKTNSPYKIFIDDNEFSMLINGVRVLWFELSGNSHAANIPELTVIRKFTLFGYLIEEDEAGNVNCEYVGE